MDINWIRQEVKKNIEEIDWIEIIRSSTALYKEVNDRSSVLGLSKGYVNFFKCAGYYTQHFIEDIKKIYPGVKIVNIRTSHQVAKLINEKIITLDSIKEDLTVVVGDKTTMESVLSRKGIPFIKFNIGVKRQRDIKTNTYSTTITWKKDGEKGIKIKEGDFVTMNRNSKLDNLLD